MPQCKMHLFAFSRSIINHNPTQIYIYAMFQLFVISMKNYFIAFKDPRHSLVETSFVIVTKKFFSKEKTAR